MSTAARSATHQESPGESQSPAPARSITSSRGNTFAVYLGHLLRRTSRSTLIWTLAIAAYGALIVAIYPSSKGTDLSAYPEALRETFNMTSMDVVEPYLSAQIFSYLPLVLAFLPMTTFAAAIAGAEERGALDVLLGTPLPRRHLVITNFVSGAVNLLLIVIVLGGVLWLGGLGVDAELSLGEALAGALAVWPVALALGSVALFLSAMVRQHSRALGLSIGVMFGMYALNVVSKLADRAAWLQYFSVFHYYGNAVQDGIFWVGTLALLGSSLMLAGAAIVMFERRDVFA